MPTIELKPGSQISLHLTGEEEKCLSRAAALENEGDVSRFVLGAALKAAKAALETDALCSKLLAASEPGSVSGTFV